jgi:orsellinic acid C2-O-methyltransferase
MSELQRERVAAGDDSTVAARRLLDLINGAWMAQAIHVAARLEVADRLAGGAQSAEELARATGAHPAALHRLLRALVTLGVCVVDDHGRFGLGALGLPLRSDAAPSLRAWAIYTGEGSWPVWGKLLDSVMSGESARQRDRTGNDGRAASIAYPGGDAMFNRAMAELTRLDTDAIVRGLDLSSRRHVVDVGGGNGELLLALLAANPGLHGVLFERPAAIEDSRAAIASSAVASRCELVAGDFFQSVPANADVYVLKSVLHNWPDDLAARILVQCAAAMCAGAVLCVVERMMPATFEPSARHRAIARADLNMLVSRGGAERTEEQYRALLSMAKLKLIAVRPAGSTFSIVEAMIRA